MSAGPLPWSPGETLRFRPRHLQQTIFEGLSTWLADLSWMAPGGFKTVPVTLIDYIPEEGGGPIAPNTVGITLGGEAAEADEELGGGLVSTPTACFVDIYGENQAIALSIASDVLDYFRKRPTIPLLDYTTSPPTVTDERIEFTNTVRERPQQTDFRRNWQVVKSTAVAYYQGID